MRSLSNSWMHPAFDLVWHYKWFCISQQFSVIQFLRICAHYWDSEGDRVVRIMCKMRGESNRRSYFSQRSRQDKSIKNRVKNGESRQRWRTHCYTHGLPRCNASRWVFIFLFAGMLSGCCWKLCILMEMSFKLANAEPLRQDLWK